MATNILLLSLKGRPVSVILGAMHALASLGFHRQGTTRCPAATGWMLATLLAFSARCHVSHTSGAPFSGSWAMGQLHVACTGSLLHISALLRRTAQWDSAVRWATGALAHCCAVSEQWGSGV